MELLFPFPPSVFCTTLSSFVLPFLYTYADLLILHPLSETLCFVLSEDKSSVFCWDNKEGKHLAIQIDEEI